MACSNRPRADGAESQQLKSITSKCIMCVCKTPFPSPLCSSNAPHWHRNLFRCTNDRYVFIKNYMVRCAYQEEKRNINCAYASILLTKAPSARTYISIFWLFSRIVFLPSSLRMPNIAKILLVLRIQKYQHKRMRETVGKKTMHIRSTVHKTHTHTHSKAWNVSQLDAVRNVCVHSLRVTSRDFCFDAKRLAQGRVCVWSMEEQCSRG